MNQPSTILIVRMPDGWRLLVDGVFRSLHTSQEAAARAVLRLSTGNEVEDV